MVSPQLLPSKRFALMDRLYSRYLLEPHPAGQNVQLSLSPVIVPVVQADAVLQTNGIDSDQAINLSGSGWVTIFTVPTNRKWELVIAHKGASAGATRFGIVVSGIRLFWIGSAAELDIDLRGITLAAGDYVQLDGTGQGGDTDISLELYRKEELLNV